MKTPPVTVNESLADPRIGALETLIAHVRTDAFAVRNANGGYSPVNEQLTTPHLERHLRGDRNLGVYLMNQGSYTTRFAAFDLDDHDGTSDWQVMSDVAKRIVCVSQEHLDWKGTAFRSGGGKGIHITFTWDDAQPASQVRVSMADVLKYCELKPGTGGLHAKEVEIFPKQDHVAIGKYGNLIALPLCRQSVLLDEEMQPRDPLNWSGFLPSPNIVLPRAPTTGKTNAGSPRESSNGLAEVAEVRLVLSFINADEYALWIKVGMALKSHFGDEGFHLWDEWSKRSPKYEDNLADKWKTFACENDTGVGIGTIYHYAKLGGYGLKSVSEIATDFAKTFGQGASSFDDILSGEIDVPAFPCGALPEPFQTFVENAAAVMQVQPDLIAVPLLCVAARMLGRDFRVQPQAVNERWTEPAILWGMCVAESGAMKSPAAKEAVEFSQSLQWKFLEEYKRECAQYEFAKALKKEGNKNG